MTEKGKPIESWFGTQNKAAVSQFYERELVVKPEDPTRSLEALEMTNFIASDPTLRLDDKGSIAVRFVRHPMEKGRPQNELVERWAIYDDAFGLIRTLEEHIGEQYIQGGEQYVNRVEAIKLLNSLLIRMKKGGIGDEEMEVWREKASSKLLDTRTMNSTHPDRVAFSQQILRATESYADNHLNLPNRRVILTSQRPHVISDQVLNEHIALFDFYRADEVKSLCDVQEIAMDKVVKGAKNLARAKVGTKTFDKDALMQYLLQARLLLSPKGSIIMQPYAKSAAKMRYALYATDFETDVITIAKYMNVKEAIDFDSEMPVVDHKDLIGMKKRIEKFSLWAEEEFNNLVESRYGGSSPKPLKEKKLTKDQQLWLWIENTTPFEDK